MTEALFENRQQALRDEQSKRKQMYGGGNFINSTTSASESPDSPDNAEKLEWDATCCFICDFRSEAGTVESCIEHMHKHHGLFIPHAQSLKDPRGLLSYLGAKVCLFMRKSYLYDNIISLL